MLVIFDLDGVLFDSKNLHFQSLNLALAELDSKFVISLEDHLNIFDGLPTKEKLNLLVDLKDFPISYTEIVFNNKQKYFLELIKTNISPNNTLIEIFKNLKDLNYKIAVASNSIRETVKISLSKLDILDYVDFYISNEDVIRPKPYPEMFWKCMIELNELPNTTLILEDSVIGRQAAINSGAFLMPINSIEEVNWIALSNKLSTNFQTKTKNKWKDDKLNILIPMAGAGSRFSAAGYTFPKPLIEVNGIPMIELVVNNLNIEANYIFIVQKSHYEKYNLRSMLQQIAPNCKIVIVDGVTEGAACTSLLAREFIDNDNPLLIANSDQFIEWDSSKFMYSVYNEDIDGALLAFDSHHPKWSYAAVDSDNFIIEIAEKKVISPHATVGIYFWKKGREYVDYAGKMIANNTRTNGEFYICPVYNEAITAGKKIKLKKIEKMFGLGTPEDLTYFLKNYN